MSTTDTKSKSQSLYEEALRVLPGGISRNTIYRKPHPDYVARGEGCRVTDIDGVTRIDFANNMAFVDSRSRASPGCRSRRRAACPRNRVYDGHRSRIAVCPAHVRSQPRFRQDSVYEFGDRGGDGRDQGGPSRDRSAQDRENRRSLSRHVRLRRSQPKIESGKLGQPDEPTQRARLSRGLRKLRSTTLSFFRSTISSGRLPFSIDMPTELACVLIDPLPHRVGLAPASEEYMVALRNWTQDNGAIFLLDEVITFRMGYGGAQDWYTVAARSDGDGKNHWRRFSGRWSRWQRRIYVGA